MEYTELKEDCIDKKDAIKSIGPEGSGCDFEIPSNISVLFKNVFSGCKNLETVILPDNITFIGRYAFSDCEKLRYIKIPETVEFISDCVFMDCKSLKKVEINGNNLRNIGEDAFYGGESLEEIVLPDSIETIEMNAFSGCNNLSEINIPNNAYEFYADLFRGEKIEKIYVSEKKLNELKKKKYDLYQRFEDKFVINTLENIINKKFDEGKSFREMNKIIKDYLEK